jgi:hypothetical protein
MAVPVNILQTVQTYQKAGLAFFQNLNCFVSTANTKYKEFNKLTANLGDTVTFDLPPRGITNNSLVVNWQPAVQRVQTLKVDKQASYPFEFTSEQIIFNIDPQDYMKNFGRSALAELGSQVESDIAFNCVSNTYRFYGDGVTPISSFGQLGQALAFFRNYGTAKNDTKCYLDDIAESSIVNSGLNQFALDRNDDLAMSWKVGRFNECEFYRSNLLPTHISGSVGNAVAPNNIMTVVSTTQDANGNVTAITFSVLSGANDANCIKQYDKIQFNNANFRYLTFVGHKVSKNPVQIQATADAASSGASQVTIQINPPLQVSPVFNQNINQPVVAGMTATVMPSHRAGLITSGNPLFLAMPQLPDQRPFDTAYMADPDTAVSIRQYFGTQFGQNAQGMVYDCIWGSTLVQENSMAFLFPL